MRIKLEMEPCDEVPVMSGNSLTYPSNVDMFDFHGSVVRKSVSITKVGDKGEADQAHGSLIPDMTVVLMV